MIIIKVKKDDGSTVEYQTETMDINKYTTPNGDTSFSLNIKDMQESVPLTNDVSVVELT